VGCGRIADGKTAPNAFGGQPRSAPAILAWPGRCASSSVGTQAATRQCLTAAAVLRWKVPRESRWGQREGRRRAAQIALAWAERVLLRHVTSARKLGHTPPIVSVYPPEHTLPFGAWRRCLGATPPGPRGRYLVDSASSHMLVSKIKPCMSKYKQLYCETANGSLNQLSFI
jgi:hypothetical protein